MGWNFGWLIHNNFLSATLVRQKNSKPNFNSVAGFERSKAKADFTTFLKVILCSFFMLS